MPTETHFPRPHNQRARQRCVNGAGDLQLPWWAPGTAHSASLSQWSASYAKPYPMKYQISAPMHASSRFFNRMFLTFLARMLPALRTAKPLCMRKMSAPAHIK